MWEQVCCAAAEVWSIMAGLRSGWPEWIPLGPLRSAPVVFCSGLAFSSLLSLHVSYQSVQCGRKLASFSSELRFVLETLAYKWTWGSGLPFFFFFPIVVINLSSVIHQEPFILGICILGIYPYMPSVMWGDPGVRDEERAGGRLPILVESAIKELRGAWGRTW